VLMFFSAPAQEGPAVVVPSPLTTASIALAAGVTLLLGVWPAQVLDLAGRASLFVR
jgi:NADH-quinone oxidoreductase subunit N